ncbi:MAG: hypothetical protein ABH864_06880 [archaeon]
MKRGQFIALLVLLFFFLIYASPTKTPYLDPGSGQCSQYTNAADCESHGCEAEYTEKAGKNALGCESTVSAFSKCKERGCTPIPGSTLSTSPSKSVLHSVPYVGDEDFPVRINIKKSGPGYTFTRLSGDRFSTETLATGEYCKVVGVNFLDGTESYLYPLEPAGQEQIDEETVLCLYRANTALMIAPLDDRMIYVFDNGVRVSNCPTKGLKDQATCKTSWEGLCTIKAAGKVQMPVLIKEYCGGWSATVLSSGQDFQAEVRTCDTSIKNAIPSPEPEEAECHNTPPSVQVSGKSSPSLSIGDKCELQWAVSDDQNQFYTALIVPKYAANLNDVTAEDLGSAYNHNPPYTKTMSYVMYKEDGTLTFSGPNIVKTVYGIAVDSGQGTDDGGKSCMSNQLNSIASKEISIPTTDFRGKKAIQLPSLNFMVTKTTYASSCDPTGVLDAGVVIETVINRWFLPETCQLTGKTDIIIKYRNIMAGSPSDDTIKEGIYKAIEAALEGGLDESSLTRIRQFIFNYYVPPPHKVWEYKPLTSEIIDGKVYLSTQGHEMNEPLLQPNKQNELLLNPPSAENFKNIKDDNGDEAIRSIRIEILDSTEETTDRCFNNLKLDDQDPPGWGDTYEKKKAMQDAKFAEMDALYNTYIKGHYDRLQELYNNLNSCFCKE